MPGRTQIGVLYFYFYSFLRKTLIIQTKKLYILLVEKEFKVKHYERIKDKLNENEYNQLIFKDISTWLEVPNDLEKLLPPFSYNILFQKNFRDLPSKTSIEIRIQTKEDFITTESYYYTIHKNDNVELNVKIPLLCMCFRILRRMSNIAFETDKIRKEKYKLEIDKIKNENNSFINENKDKLECIFAEHSELINCWNNKLPIYNFKRN